MSELNNIEVLVNTNSKYGRVKPEDVLTVGEQIDEKAAERWINNGLAKPTNLKKTRTKPKDDDPVELPTEKNTVKQIKAYLTEKEIEFESNLTKDELLALVSDDQS